jgi:hypothetical protein
VTPPLSKVPCQFLAFLGVDLMFGKPLFAMLMLVLMGLTATAHAADDPTMHQIYAAAEAGQFPEAQRMMDKVLEDHPNSAKAHFVEAELLAKQGRIANAAVELSKAETLAPGLPFAKPEAVRKLQRLVAGSHSSISNGYVAQPPANASSGSSWVGVLLGGGLIAALIFGVRALFARRSAPTYMPSGAACAGYGVPSTGPIPSASGGLGSSIVSGLATGAAVGAGMVAGEALVHHFLDGDRRDGQSHQPPNDNGYVPADDMGGNDFGVSDSSSWDDSSGGGGDDSW